MDHVFCDISDIGSYRVYVSALPSSATGTGHNGQTDHEYVWPSIDNAWSSRYAVLKPYVEMIYCIACKYIVCIGVKAQSSYLSHLLESTHASNTFYVDVEQPEIHHGKLSIYTSGHSKHPAGQVHDMVSSNILRWVLIVFGRIARHIVGSDIALSPLSSDKLQSNTYLSLKVACRMAYRTCRYRYEVWTQQNCNALGV